MDPAAYFKDLTSELRAVQNRIRNLIGNKHWPSDGIWKESVLRAILRRYLPPSWTVGSGFFITPDDVSTQIDILIFDDSAPILFRDGDFLIATADCVRAVVEVKTSLHGSEIRDTLRKLNDISYLMRRRLVHHPPFLGLFSYEDTTAGDESILDHLGATSGESVNYVITSLCFGESRLVRFWDHKPPAVSGTPYYSWHLYHLPENAPGYFVHSLVEHLFPHAFKAAENMWYPAEDLEQFQVAKKCRRSDLPLDTR